MVLGNRWYMAVASVLFGCSRGLNALRAVTLAATFQGVPKALALRTEDRRVDRAFASEASAVSFSELGSQNDRDFAPSFQTLSGPMRVPRADIVHGSSRHQAQQAQLKIEHSAYMQCSNLELSRISRKSLHH